MMAKLMFGHMTLVKNSKILLFLVFAMLLLCTSCDMSKRRMQKAVGLLQTSTIHIPINKMGCWQNDSIISTDRMVTRKLKLVHFIDSIRCSSCFLQKISLYDELFQLEEETKYDFINIFIIEPRKKDKERLLVEYENITTPLTIFVDTTHVFIKSNPIIPVESALHTFLLDENNKVILVGNPLANPKMRELFLTMVDDKLGRNKILKK